MQRELLYLADIVEAADEIAALIAGYNKASFVADSRTHAAVTFYIANIGEAVRNISDEIKDRYLQAARYKARTMRNIITHQYFAIEWPIVWDTAADDILVLRNQVAAILASEYPDMDLNEGA